MFWEAFLAVLGLLFFFFPSFFWLLRYRRRKAGSPPILLYHKVDRRPELGGTWNLPSQFEAHLRYLKEREFEVVPLSLILDDPQGRRMVSLTFDDGYEDVYYYAFPLLRRFGFPATVFLVAGYIGEENLWDVALGKRFRHLTWDQIEEMREYGLTFGSHTMTHPDLTRIPLDRVRYELEQSKELLEARLRERVRFVSYPFGRYDEEVERIAEQAGYEACFCSFRGSSRSSLDRYAVGRRGMYIVDTAFDFRAKVDPSNLLLLGLEEMKGRVINAFSHGTPLVKSILRKSP